MGSVKRSNADLLIEVREGRRRGYGWGLGYIFDACRFVHGMPLHAVIHTSPEMVGRRTRGLPVLSPESLLDVDPSTSLVIGYSSAFREQIADFCAKRVPALPLIFFDDPALSRQSVIGELAQGLRQAVESKLLKPAELRTLRSFLCSPGATHGRIADLVEQGFDFWKEFISDVYRALARQVHFIYQENIQGDIAEFGTCSGATATALSAAMADAPTLSSALGGYLNARPRILHLFDSFEGLPEITHDLDISAGWKKGMFRGLSESQLLELMESNLPRDQIRIYPGWFKDTMANIASTQKFALVHIDCDTYESTFNVLDALLKNDHLSDGCALFFDDWNCGRASPDLGERRAWREVVKKYAIRYSDCGGYSAFGNKFLVHDGRGTTLDLAQRPIDAAQF